MGGGRMDVDATNTWQTDLPHRVRAAEIAREVNELLDINSDPLGVLRWWNSPNRWLLGSPWEILFTRLQEEVLEAAKNVGSDAY